MQDRCRALRHPGEKLIEDIVLLGHARALRHRPRYYLFAPEVVYRREIGLAPRLLELRDVGAHLLPRALRSEVAPQHVLEGLADEAFVRSVLVIVGFAADAAADPHLVHDLQHRLVRDARAALGAQAHGDLPMSAAVGSP